MQGRQAMTAFMMGGPALILMLVFMVYPFIKGIDLSRTDQRFDGSDPNAVGWENYDDLLSVAITELPEVPDEVPKAVTESASPIRFEAHPCQVLNYYKYNEENKTAARELLDEEQTANTAGIRLNRRTGETVVTGVTNPLITSGTTTVEVQITEDVVTTEDGEQRCVELPDEEVYTTEIEVPETFAYQETNRFGDDVYYLGELGGLLPGWYEDRNGNLRFGWRDLDSMGLGEYEEYRIWERIELGEGTYYAILAKDPRFWEALWHNFYFVIVVVPVQTAFALLLAILINQRIRGMNVYRTIYFSPVVTAMAVIAVVWEFLYNPQQGLINETLKAITNGNLGEDLGWLQDPSMAMPAIMILSIWQGVGFQMIIFLAGLQDIPEDLYEAASIDGAGVMGKFRFVTLPMLRNTMIFVVLTTTILAFRLFDQIQVLTPEGGPENSTSTIVWYAIRRGWAESQIGYAAAISIVFVGLVLLVSIVQRIFLRSERAID
jgi:multiple sugar transport system permease protein